MKKILAVLALAFSASASAQIRDQIAPDGSYTIFRDSQGRTIMGMGVLPTPNQNLGITGGMPFYDGPTSQWYWYTGTSWVSAITMATLTLTAPTITTPTITSPTITGTATIAGVSATTVQSQEYTVSLTADAVTQPGQIVMPDAGTANRFDVATGSGTLAIGIFSTSSGVRAAQATAYPVAVGGLTRVVIAEDADGALGEYLTMSATAGYANAGAISTIGQNIGRILETAPVTNVIAHNGCTGAAGCINTALDTPNAGPAGQITLSADVAAQGWAVGDPVVYWNSGGVVATGLLDGFVYWLVSVSTTNVTLAATRGGAVIVPSSQGTDATQYLQKLPLATISIQ